MRPPLALLLLGGAAGIGAAAYDHVRAEAASRAALPLEMVARVNGRPIAAEDFDRLLARQTGGDPRKADAAARRHVLDRLIEEELLVQRGLKRGVARTDARVRGELRAAVTAALMREAPANPDAAELRRFYEENRADFVAAGQEAKGAPPLAAIEPDVRAAYRAHVEHEALRACLADLRARGSVEILQEPR